MDAADHYYIPWTSGVLYTVVVLGIYRWMRYKPPVEFGPYVLPTWNAVFAICNLMVFTKVAPTRLNLLWNYGIAHSNCRFYSHVGTVAFWNCVFLLSKFVWIIDTMFIILRKKTLTPFRFFHHISLVRVLLVHVHRATGHGLAIFSQQFGDAHILRCTANNICWDHL